MATGLISIVLKAVDNYSNVITGLNQGFDLIGKGLSAVQAVADTAFAAISKGIETASAGGNYVEMRRQLNNVAVSYGQDGKSILDMVDKIGLNFVSLADRSKIAGKAITAGLSENQLEQALTFIKRRTELTGESFQQLAETVFTSISGGRTSVLNQLGLVVEKGASTADIIAEMARKTEAFGDTGFNTADKIAALREQMSRFFTIIGVAINEMPLFQRIMTTITDSVVSFIRWLDPRPISIFLQSFGTMMYEIVSATIEAVPAISNMFSDLFSGTAGTFNTFVSFFGTKIFEIVKSAGSGINLILDLLSNSGFVRVTETIMNTIIWTVSQAIKGVSVLVGKLVRTVIDGWSEIYGLVGDMAREFPLLAEQIGVDPLKMAETERSLKLMARSSEEAAYKVAEGFEWISEAAPNAIIAISDALSDTRFNMDFFDDVQKDFEESISKIDGGDWGESLGVTIAKGAENAFKDIMNIADVKALEKQEKEYNKIAKDQEKAAKKAADEEKKRLKEVEKTKEEQTKEEEKRLKDINKLASEAEDNFKDLPRVTKDAAGNFAIMGDIASTIGGVMKLSITDFEIFYSRLERLYKLEAEAPYAPYSRLIESLKNVNWPAEFKALGEFIFQWTLLVAAGEPVPLAITTTGV